jgi:hypothetical protein
MTFYNQMKAHEAAQTAMKANPLPSNKSSNSLLNATTATTPVSSNNASSQSKGGSAGADMSGVSVHTASTLKPSAATAVGGGASRWYHFGFLGYEDEGRLNDAVVKSGGESNLSSPPARSTTKEVHPVTTAATDAKVASPIPKTSTPVPITPSAPSSSSSSSSSSTSTTKKTSSSVTAIPLPKFGARSFYGMELVMGTAFPTLIDEIPIVKLKQEKMKPYLKLMKAEMNDQLLTQQQQQQSPSPSQQQQVQAVKISKRLEQASLLVEAVLSWFVKRPQTPSLMSAPATSAAIVALKK